MVINSLFALMGLGTYDIFETQCLYRVIGGEICSV